jgi:hypothetical protein
MGIARRHCLVVLNLQLGQSLAKRGTGWRLHYHFRRGGVGSDRLRLS